MADTGVDVEPLVDEGLGNTCYLLDTGDGWALVVDPPRDLRAVRAAAKRRGLRIAWAAETHLHADFLSGAVQLAADDGARILASAGGGRVFDHVGLGEGDEVDLGGLVLRAWATPGHTDEHLAFLLLDGDRPLGVFTGGSLLVGSAARTDLLGAERAEELARAQYASLRRLSTLPEEVAVWPTHGAGSFCSAPAAAKRTSTIGEQKASNPLLAAPDEDTFVKQLLGSLGSYPTYFSWLAEANRRGPKIVVGDPALAPLDAARVRALLADGAQLVDVRPVVDFAAGHVPGAVSIPLRPQFATWLGWLLPPDAPLVFVRNADQDPVEICWQALKIGYERLAGELGIDAWVAAGGPLRRTRLVTPDAIWDAPVLDVRQDAEYAAGHLPGADHLELGALRAHELVDGPRVVMCGHGERAMSAASLLERAGHRQVAVLVGGADDWAKTTGRTLTQGA